ncbi:MAG: rhomboid family intramembrane serine protease [Gaiellaceae bacterium]
MRCYRHPDRETGLACSVCERPICTDCATWAPVGLRCPEHSGKAQGVRRVTRSVQRAGAEGTGAVLTRALIGINVLVYLATIASGAGVNANSGRIYEKGALFGPYVATGDYWRLLTSAFMHYGPLHLLMNMWVLWWIGGPLEERLGRARFIALYIVSGLAGSAGALLNTPCSPTVGASGAIFGLFGAALVLERQGVFVFGGSVIGVIVLNLAFTFAVPGISIGGHVGGLAGGAVGTLAMSRFGRGHAAYSRLGLLGTVSLIAVGVASVVIAVWAAKQGCSPIL